MVEINQKILAFAGSQECVRLLNALSKYTDRIYVVMAPQYGEVEHPTGNLTIISGFLDRDAMQRWIDRTGIEVVIDGTAAGNREIQTEILQAAEENNLEYIRVREEIRLSSNIHLCATKEDVLKEIQYSSETILVEGEEMYRLVADHARDSQKVIAAAFPDTDEISDLVTAGCPSSNIISFGMTLHHSFILSLFEELDIHHVILDCKTSRSLAEKIKAINHSNVKGHFLNRPDAGDGQTAPEIWKILAKRYGITDRYVL